MTATPEHRTTPHHLLLATDLSARCDRALDRAAQLAGEWQAELVALNVLDASATPDQALAWAGGASDEALLRVARQQLAGDLAAANVTATLRLVRSRDVSGAIRQTAAATRSGLVVTAVANDETLGRLFLGSTVESLARSMPQPLLVVRNRPRGPYRRIVVATDCSEPSRHALLVAARFFPGRELTLYHAHEPGLAGLAGTLPQPASPAGIEATECAAFLASTPLPEGTVVHTVIERGPIESSLSRHVREQGVDLVVMGSHGRSSLMSILLGSTAAKLLDWLPCDTLLVREQPASA